MNIYNFIMIDGARKQASLDTFDVQVATRLVGKLKLTESLEAFPGNLQFRFTIQFESRKFSFQFFAIK